MMKKLRKILPPIIFYTLICTNIVLYFIISIPKLLFFPFNLLGIIPIISGIFLNIWTDEYLKKFKTTVKPGKIPSRLITIGPFSFSRHPMYLGMSLILFGEALLFGALVNFIVPIVFIFYIEKVFIPFEERTLLTWFPEDYMEYKKNVRRWM
jgi:protein-S-isoprenylcysteine O-methyltransferase Ste14